MPAVMYDFDRPSRKSFEIANLEIAIESNKKLLELLKSKPGAPAEQILFAQNVAREYQY
jgi:hypothetical protein